MLSNQSNINVINPIVGATEYPTIDCWNCARPPKEGEADKRWFLLLRPNANGILDHFGLYAADGTFLQDLPISASDEPRWDSNRSHIIYFHEAPGNTLWSMDLESGKEGAVRTFHEYAAITTGGKGTLSEDGDHFAIVGTLPSLDTTIAREIFVYQISTNTKGPVFSTTGPVNNVFITPDNNVMVSWFDTEGQSVHSMDLFDQDMKLLRAAVRANGHCDFGRGLDGKEKMYWTNSAEPNPVTVPDCQNGIIEVDLATNAQRGLLSIPWDMSVHISARAVNTTRKVLVETYGVPSAESLANKILLLGLDGKVEVLCDHPPPVTGDYDTEPLSTISADGTRILYRSGKNQTAMLVLDTSALVPSAPVPVTAAPVPTTSTPITIEERVSRLEQQVAGLLAK